MPDGRSIPSVEEDYGDINEEDVLEVVELEEGEAYDSEDEEMMEDEEELFDEPAVDHASLVFTHHEKSVFTVALDPSGAVAASGGEDDMAFVWKVTDGKVMFQCDGHKDSVVSVCFSHDGSMVATGDMSGLIKVWKVATGKEVWIFECSDLEWMTWHPVAPVLLAGTVDGSSWMWKIPSGDCKTYAGPNCPASVGRLLPDGKKMCVGYGDGSLRLWDLKTSTVVHTVSDAHAANVTCMDVDREGNLVISGSLDGAAKLLNTNTGKIVSTLRCSADYEGMNDEEESDVDSVEAVGLSFASPTAATGSLSGQLLIWDLNTQTLRHDPALLKGGLTRLLWDQTTGQTLFCSCLDGTASVWDSRTGKIVKEWTGHRGQILDLAVSPMSNFILTSSSDHTLRLFPMASSD